VGRTFIRYLDRHHVALLALLVALGGTSYAATAIPRGSVGTAQLRANAVVSSKVKNNSLTGADIRESSLGRVGKASEATHAKTADTATTANDAFSRYHQDRLLFPPSAGPQPVVALYIPHGGNYIVTASFTAVNFSSSDAFVDCQLNVAADGFNSGAPQLASYDLQPGAAQVVTFHFAAPLGGTGQAQLYCQDVLDVGNVGAQDIRITAVQVGNLTVSG